MFKRNWSCDHIYTSRQVFQASVAFSTAWLYSSNEPWARGEGMWSLLRTQECILMATYFLHLSYGQCGGGRYGGNNLQIQSKSGMQWSGGHLAFPLACQEPSNTPGLLAWRPSSFSQEYWGWLIRSSELSVDMLLDLSLNEVKLPRAAVKNTVRCSSKEERVASMS